MWIRELKREYADGARKLIRYRESLNRSEGGDPHPDLKVVEEMIADLHFGIEWMRTGRQPNRSRGADVHDAFSRTVLMEMDLIPTRAPERQEMKVSEEQKAELLRILTKLSARETAMLSPSYGALDERERDRKAIKAV